MSSSASRDSTNSRPSKARISPATQPSRVEPVRRRTNRIITRISSVPTTAGTTRQPSGVKPNSLLAEPDQPLADLGVDRPSRRPASRGRWSARPGCACWRRRRRCRCSRGRSRSATATRRPWRSRSRRTRRRAGVPSFHSRRNSASSVIESVAVQPTNGSSRRRRRRARSCGQRDRVAVGVVRQTASSGGRARRRGGSGRHGAATVRVRLT